MPENADEKALIEAFKPYGQVRKGGVTTKQGRKDLFAFVEFVSADDMDSVLKFLGGKVKINGQMVTVEEKRPMVIRSTGKGRKNLNGHTQHTREAKVPVSAFGKLFLQLSHHVTCTRRVSTPNSATGITWPPKTKKPLQQGSLAPCKNNVAARPRLSLEKRGQPTATR